MLVLATKTTIHPQVLRLVSRSLSNNTIKFPVISNLSNPTKLVLSVSGYLLTSVGIAAIADRKNLGYVFKQLGEW